MSTAGSKSKSEGAGIVLVLTLLLILPFAAWYGFVIETLWRWFVVPLHVVTIGLWEAAGLYLLVRLFTYQPSADDPDKTPYERLGAAIAYGILAPAMTLAFAAIYHGFAK